MDSFLGTKRPTVISNSINDDEFEDDGDIEYNKRLILPSRRLRQDYLIGGVLSLVLLFSIAIFQKIFNNDSEAIITDVGPQIQNIIEPIFSIDLQKNYILDQTSEELLPVTPPFFIKIKTLEQTAYTFIRDTLSPVSRILKPNQELDLEAFINNSELIFSTTKGISIFINATEIKKVSDYNFPIRLAINSKPPSVRIQRFKPLP